MLARIRQALCDFFGGHDMRIIRYRMGGPETWRCSECGAVQYEGRRVA